ncbi:MAG: orotate phosphoribosyltransferase [Firmicutes bacterium]|nr:orotate phosphoribosyltransferase [Bacillota bacterium]
MTNDEILEIFQKTGGVLKGHFLLTSGRHADTYMQCAKLFVDSECSEKLCSALAQKLKDFKADVVVSPAVGGILMGYEMARQLKLPNIFFERESGKFCLRRGFSLAKGTKVIVVEDVVTTGGSVKEVVAEVHNLGGEVVAVASIVDRSAGKVDFGTKFVSLLSVDIKSYEADECPICSAGEIPLYKPGSRIV